MNVKLHVTNVFKNKKKYTSSRKKQAKFSENPPKRHKVKKKQKTKQKQTKNKKKQQGTHYHTCDLLRCGIKLTIFHLSLRPPAKEAKPPTKKKFLC